MAKKSVPPLDNIVYYPRGIRVLWNDEPGVVDRVVIKPQYEDQVRYDILLDSEIYEEEPDIKRNSSYHELVEERTGKKRTDGQYVEPLKEVEY
ncbi:hypothetical protein IQ270_04375 [Microcoleus sp. LEGE 07076]|uniref:hypothetical protein n=1 Tax=Microcoleus sp. LEGE 07076 TaxID=915322 RepID=UPI00188077B0|nr:hypothetical protein [Microcoleus sp. LEGE 07076]MBE9183978.1 hypothetical protein [Microcoleus sp. LEGE 07076]